LEQAVFQAVEAAEGRVLFAFFKIVGTSVDRVVQLREALRCRSQALVSLPSW